MDAAGSDVARLHRDNGAAWDETAAIYERDEERDVVMLRADSTNLLPPEQRALGDLSRWCRRAVHLQCSGGLDTLSLWKAGAAEVVGVDISPRMIASARRRAEALGAPAQFHCCDVLDTPHSLDGTADLVHTGRGALPWVMDLSAWAAVVARLLRPGGLLHVFEGHPLDGVWDAEADDLRLNPNGAGYFDGALGGGVLWPRPFLERAHGPDAARYALHERQWPLGDVINALLAAGLRLERFEEHPECYWDPFKRVPPETLRRVPHTYTLLMRKDRTGGATG